MERTDCPSHNLLTDLRSAEASEHFHSNAEFRLPPAGIADMPHYSSEQQLLPMALSGLDLAELGRRVELLQESLPLLTHPANSDLQYSKTTLFRQEECSKSESRHIQNKDTAPTAYTFVNVQTSTGRRDWAAETQIRSHAMKRVHQQRRKFKHLPQTVSGNSSSAIKLSCPHWRQDPKTCMCSPCMGSASTVNQGTWGGLNVTENRSAPSFASSIDRLSKADYCHYGQLKLAPQTDPHVVAIPAPNSFFQSSFLSVLNKPEFEITPRMESMLHYRK
jgi:hypothetical protein